MKRDGDGYRLESRHLRPTFRNSLNNAGEPDWWFYEDEKGIDVYHQSGNAVQSAAIPKQWLLEYARISAAPEILRLRKENDRLSQSLLDMANEQET